MKIKYLGTAAAEGIPAMFCHCDVCEQARKNKGKDFRTRSQTIIDDELLIDFSADTYHHVLTQGLELHKIKHCLITHSHSDHIIESEFEFKAIGYAVPKKSGVEPLHVYGSEAVRKKLSKILFATPAGDIVKFHALMPFTEYDIGGYKVVPLKARHDVYSGPYIYIISKDGKNLLYANDTGCLPNETRRYLENCGIKFDYASLDCTAGIGPIDYDSHMNFEQDVELKKWLIEIGCADENTVFCINHFSHNGGHVLHDELSRGAAKEDFLTSYDGFEYTF